MKKTILVAIIAVLLLSWATAILAQDNKTPIVHGPFYFLKTWKEQIKSLFTFGKAGQQPSIKPVVDDKKTEICAQVITWAINPAGKICKQFSTPCEVPAGWKKVDKCPVPAAKKCNFGQFVKKNCPDKKRIYNCVCNKDGKWDCPSPETACPKLLDVKYQDCPDGKTKVVSCESYQEGTWQCSVNSELKCPLMHKPPVTNGAKCKKAGEVKYYKCPGADKKIPWCACGPEGGWKGAKNKWQCIRFPELACVKPAPPPPSPTSTPPTARLESGIACCVAGEVCKVFPADDYNKATEQCRGEGRLTGASNCSPDPCKPFSPPTNVTATPTTEDVACQKGQMEDYKCTDGTAVKWQCKCMLHKDGEESRHCVVAPVESCAASYGSAPLAISWIWTRYDLWLDTKETGGSIRMAIFWATNKPTASWIEYGPTAAYGSKTSLSHFSPNYNHNAMSFSGLERNTTYHFRIIAEDDKGNKVVSDDYTFTTGL